MLQIKYILLNGKENFKLYSEIINEVAREYQEFKGYKINNNLEGLLLEFDVNNNYRDFNLTFLKEDFEFENKKKGTEYSVAYFDNEKQTNVKFILDKYDDTHIRIQSIKNNKVINVVTLSQKDSIESIVYNFSTYSGNLVEEGSKKTVKNLSLDRVCEKILDYFGINMGYLFSKSSKRILANDIEKILS